MTLLFNCISCFGLLAPKALPGGLDRYVAQAWSVVLSGVVDSRDNYPDVSPEAHHDSTGPYGIIAVKSARLGKSERYMVDVNLGSYLHCRPAAMLSRTEGNTAMLQQRADIAAVNAVHTCQ